MAEGILIDIGKVLQPDCKPQGIAVSFAIGKMSGCITTEILPPIPRNSGAGIAESHII
jgi:hypothetical protein